MERLIKKIRQYPVLYDTNNPYYLKLNAKKMIWDKIAHDLNFKSGNQPRELWRKLRNSHRDALRRRDEKLQSGFPESLWKPWKYEHQMKFLEKHMINRNFVDSKSMTYAEIEDTENETENSQHIFEDTTNTKNKEKDVTLEKTAENPWSTPLHTTVTIEKIDYEDSDSDEIFTEDCSKSPRKAPKNNGEATTANIQTLKQTNNALERDELYNFYMSMYNVTRELPLNRQIKLKRLIFNAVTDEQEQEFVSCSSNSKQAFILDDPINISKDKVRFEIIEENPMIYK